MTKRLGIVLVALVLAGCAPRDGFADRALGIDSITNGRAKATGAQPLPPP